MGTVPTPLLALLEMATCVALKVRKSKPQLARKLARVIYAALLSYEGP
jgi:hypothetical protein